MIQTEYRNDRGEMEPLTHHDLKYWEGPYRFEPYPMALYRSTTGEQKPEMKIVRSEAERERLGSGWAETPDAAREIRDGYEADIARAAAEFNADARRMSEKAQAEVLAADRATDNFITDIQAPKRGPGRPKTNGVTA